MSSIPKWFLIKYGSFERSIVSKASWRSLSRRSILECWSLAIPADPGLLIPLYLLKNVSKSFTSCAEVSRNFLQSKTSWNLLGSQSWYHKREGRQDSVVIWLLSGPKNFELWPNPRTTPTTTRGKSVIHRPNVYRIYFGVMRSYDFSYHFSVTRTTVMVSRRTRMPRRDTLPQ